MRKLLILIVFSVWFVACNEGDDASGELTVAQAQATTASEVDGGESPVVVFQRATEGPSSLEEWRIYAGGRAVTIRPATESATSAGAQVSETEVDAGAVDALLQNLEAAGFYEAAEAGEQRWEDSLTYVISTQREGEWHSLAIERVTAQTSPVRLQSLGVIEQFIFEEIGDGR